ncbi:MAG: DUF1330 domain-containing protein [Deltaproteobacteria bacterium]
MAAYMIAQLNVRDQDGYSRYVSNFVPILTQYEGEIVVVDRDCKLIEGEWPYQTTVVLKFPDEEQAMRWYNSPEYQEIVQDRIRAAETNLILVKSYK